MVTYAEPHLLLRMLGTFGAAVAAPQEMWGCGIRIETNAAVLIESEKVAFLESVAGPIQGFHNNSATGAHNQAWLTHLTAAFIGVDGKYVGGNEQETTVRQYSTPAAGFDSTLQSWDVARTYTLRTTLGRGRGHVGRFYWPCSRGLTDNGRWSAPECQAAALKAKEMLDAVNAAAAAIWPQSDGICVASPLGAPLQSVIRVEVGRAPDTQRRRTKALVEDYQGEDLASAVRLRQELGDRIYEATEPA